MPDLPSQLEIDKGKLRQVLVNLVGNAFKFTESGTIKVTFLTQQEAEQLVLVVKVEDTGSGISAEAQAHVFEPFYQIEQANRHHLLGTGLGLAITARLLALMQGEIQLTSEAGQGSTFLVRIPVLHWGGESLPTQEWWEDEQLEKSLEIDPETQKNLHFHLQLVLQNKNLSQIRSFADELQRISQTEPGDGLETYANQLSQALNTYDIGQINDLLAKIEAQLA